jgi:hypothetical protein
MFAKLVNKLGGRSKKGQRRIKAILRRLGEGEGDDEAGEMREGGPGEPE